ncbi:hypothetical protein AS156_28540 [Bradyrhizobium macuxiense]|uniref:Uncharacterized protein n=1 Tax=Bradyrhizobium macuxiense TaxID=1755647 RepID=A0A125QAH5_9BRAD|nr:hypothetical protein AS156_28540 [Bradyrhizobium macuxiense]
MDRSVIFIMTFDDQRLRRWPHWSCWSSRSWRRYGADFSRLPDETGQRFSNGKRSDECIQRLVAFDYLFPDAIGLAHSLTCDTTLRVQTFEISRTKLFGVGRKVNEACLALSGFRCSDL